MVRSPLGHMKTIAPTGGGAAIAAGATGCHWMPLEPPRQLHRLIGFFSVPKIKD